MLANNILPDEQLDDLQPFNPRVFAKAMFEDTATTHADEED